MYPPAWPAGARCGRSALLFHVREPQSRSVLCAPSHHSRTSVIPRQQRVAPAGRGGWCCMLLRVHGGRQRQRRRCKLLLLQQHGVRASLPIVWRGGQGGVASNAAGCPRQAQRRAVGGAPAIGQVLGFALCWAARVSCDQQLLVQGRGRRRLARARPPPTRRTPANRRQRRWVRLLLLLPGRSHVCGGVRCPLLHTLLLLLPPLSDVCGQLLGRLQLRQQRGRVLQRPRALACTPCRRLVARRVLLWRCRSRQGVAEGPQRCSRRCCALLVLAPCCLSVPQLARLCRLTSRCRLCHARLIGLDAQRVIPRQARRHVHNALHRPVARASVARAAACAAVDTRSLCCRRMLQRVASKGACAAAQGKQRVQSAKDAVSQRARAAAALRTHLRGWWSALAATCLLQLEAQARTARLQRHAC